MPAKHLAARNKPRREDKNAPKRGSRKFLASAGRSPRELIAAAMKTTKEGTRLPRKFSSDGEDGAISKNGAKNKPAPVFNYPKSELEAAIQRYVDLFDFAPIGYVAFDGVGHIEEINLTAARLLNRDREHLVGVPFAVCVAKGDAQLFLRHLLQCRSSDGLAKTELHLKTRSGVEFPVLLSSTPISLSMKDGARLYQTAIVDLTERKQAEEALRESEERHRAILNQTIVGMASSDLKGRLIFVNQKFCQMLGYKQAELVGKTIREITHPEDRAKNTKLFRRMIAKNAPYQWEKRFIRKDGSILWTSVSASPLLNVAGKTHSAVAVFIDIGDRRKAQTELEEAKNFLEDRVREQTEELHTANKQLMKEVRERRGLEGKILEVSDREQQRLGEELHDGICQHLTAVSFMAHAVAVRLKDHRVFEVEDIEKIAELVNAAAGDVRNLARGLHRIDVDADGLVTALQNLVDREIWKIPCRLEVKRPFQIEDNEAAVHLYRIAREAVINAAKHAQAREIVIALSRGRNGIVLSVTDDGTGIPADVDRSKGMGFHIMSHRARAAGGYLEIESPRKGGTRVVCCLPKAK
jgi:PAS domain S-box-containing protein